MDYVEFCGRLKETTDNFFIVSGEDSFLISKVHDKLYEKAEISCKELDYARFDDENFSVDAFLTAIMQMPTLSKCRMVVCQFVQVMTSNDKKKLKENFFLPKDCFFLVITNKQSESFDFLPGFSMVDCKRLSYNILKKYISREFAKKNISIREDGAIALCDACGNYMSRISTEVEKLKSLTPSGQIIEKNIIFENVSSELECDVFSFSNALLSKDVEKSIIILNNLLKKKEDPQIILSLCQANIRRMFLALISSDSSESEIASKLKVKEYAIKKAKDSAKNFSVKVLKGIEEMLLEIDIMAKNGEMPFDLALYYTIFYICKKEL